MLLSWPKAGGGGGGEGVRKREIPAVQAHCTPECMVNFLTSHFSDEVTLLSPNTRSTHFYYTYHKAIVGVRVIILHRRMKE